MPLITALGTPRPAAALALAKAQPHYLQTVPLLIAAAFQPKAVQAAIITSVFSEEQNRTIQNLALVNSFDPALANTLYTHYKTLLEAESTHLDGCDCNSGCGCGCNSAECSSTISRVYYAYLLGTIDPVEARLIVETEYAVALDQAQHQRCTCDLYYFPQAMCALDLQRAQEMAGEIGKDDQRLQSSIRAAIMQYLLMSRIERVTMPWT